MLLVSGAAFAIPSSASIRPNVSGDFAPTRGNHSDVSSRATSTLLDGRLAPRHAKYPLL